MKEYVRILIADQEPVMRNLLLRVLETEGYQVNLASSGGETLDKLSKEKFDILLVDSRMPNPSGIELLKTAKAEFPDMAVIMMIAYGEAHIVKEALLNGADEYITKPFKSHEVSLIVERSYWRLHSTRNTGKAKEQVVSGGPVENI